jgi:CDP-glycerol glycerophosphotransferase (TagB/SpsB family)
MSAFQQIKLSHLRFYTNNDLDRMNIQLYELLAYANKLITDYSTVALDYLLLNRSIGYVNDDIADFNKSRGFVFENYLDYCPGPKIDTTAKFIDFIYSSKDEYKKQRKEILNFYHFHQTGNACATIAQIFEL